MIKNEVIQLGKGPINKANIISALFYCFLAIHESDMDKNLKVRMNAKMIWLYNDAVSTSHGPCLPTPINYRGIPIMSDSTLENNVIIISHIDKGHAQIDLVKYSPITEIA